MADLPKNQRVAYDSQTLFNTKIQAKPGLSAPAMVPYVARNTIQYDPKQILSMPDSMFAHEQEHILDNRAEQRYGPTWNKAQALQEAYAAAGGTTDFQPAFRSALATTPVQQRLEALGLSDGYTSGYPIVSPKGEWSNGAPLHELLASLSGYEQAKNVDLTKDPVLGKALFADPAFVAAYKASTGLRTERLDAKDLAPYTPDIGKKR